ncbi:MAG: PEP-CTERM sorting domain-containing protein [Nitrosospira sp.]|nr:PEP-CTERM sorting domain-containing protein [Nitrosospira sp.]
MNVSITGDTDSNVAFWTIDINSPAHPDVKLDEFYFNMSGLASDYTFSNFSPADWNVQSPATVQGAGGATFMFESLDPAGPPNAADVTNTQNLTFMMTYAGGNFTTGLFTNAPIALANDAGTGQLGAHLQSLTTAGNCGTSTNCSDSGFAFGGYDPGTPPEQISEPVTLALLGLGLLGIAATRRRKK